MTNQSDIVQNKFFEGYGDNPDKKFMNIWDVICEFDVLSGDGQGENNLCDNYGNSFELPDYLPF